MALQFSHSQQLTSKAKQHGLKQGFKKVIKTAIWSFKMIMSTLILRLNLDLCLCLGSEGVKIKSIPVLKWGISSYFNQFTNIKNVHYKSLYEQDSDIIFQILPISKCTQPSLQIPRGPYSLNWLIDFCQIFKSGVKLTRIQNLKNMAANMSPNPR